MDNLSPYSNDIPAWETIQDMKPQTNEFVITESIESITEKEKKLASPVVRNHINKKRNKNLNKSLFEAELEKAMQKKNDG